MNYRRAAISARHRQRVCQRRSQTRRARLARGKGANEARNRAFVSGTFPATRLRRAHAAAASRNCGNFGPRPDAGISLSEEYGRAHQSALMAAERGFRSCRVEAPNYARSFALVVLSLNFTWLWAASTEISCSRLECAGVCQWFKVVY